MKRMIGLSALGLGLVVLAAAVALFSSESGGVVFMGTPLLLGAGVAVLVLGWRGRAVLGYPSCAKCKYDLRGLLGGLDHEALVCPECGADLHRPAAVDFGRYAKRPRLMVVGGAMALLPVLTFLAMMVPAMLGVRWSWEAVKPAGWVIADLKSTAAVPWTWNELDRRYRAGRLDRAKVGQAVGQLVNHLKQQRAQGRRRKPLAWSEQFLEHVRAGGDLTPKRYRALCAAYYGLEPKLNVPSHVRANEPIRFSFQAGRSWQLPGGKLWVALREVRLARGAAALKPLAQGFKSLAQPGHTDALSYGRRAGLSVKATLEAPRPAGPHELVFTFDMGVVDENQPPVGFNGRPGQASKWQHPRATWTRTLRRKIVVRGIGQPAVPLVKDPKLDPKATGAIKVVRAYAVPMTRGVRVTVRMEHDGPGAPVPVVTRGYLRIDGKEYRASHFGYFANTRIGGHFGVEVKTLPASVDKLDVILRPDPQYASSQSPRVDRIWGKPIEFKDVALERHDVPGSAKKEGGG